MHRIGSQEILVVKRRTQTVSLDKDKDMLFHLLVGIVAALSFAWLLNSVQKSEKPVQWWQWVLTILGIVFAIFTLEVIFGFIDEGAGQAALVVGLIMGIITVVWGVLLGRFVFAPSKQ
jgi:hypothetical protein